MAGADDDIEKLLREVEGALGTGSAGAVQPAQSAPSTQKATTSGFSEALPRATAVGVVWGVGVGGVFFVLPFVHSISGAIGAFVTGFSVSLVGRLRR